MPRERYRDRHPSAADVFWVIEVSNSSLTKDLELKKQVYATAGIQQYWILDLKSKQLIVFRAPQGADYQFKQKMQTGEGAPLAFPEVIVSVDGLLS